MALAADRRVAIFTGIGILTVNNRKVDMRVVLRRTLLVSSSVRMSERMQLATRTHNLRSIGAQGLRPVGMILLVVSMTGWLLLTAQAADLKTIIGQTRGITNAVVTTNAAIEKLAATNVASTNRFSNTTSTNSIDDKIKLGIGDRLSLRIVEDQEDAKGLVVTDSGDLDVPYIGRVKAQDKTCRELAKEIKARLEEEYYYRATVVIAIDQFNRSRGKVYLVGHVGAPGPQEIPSDELFTLSKAVMRAGGFTDFADKKHVRVTRSGGTNETGGKILQVDVGAIIEEGRAEKDIKLEPGDLVYVPSRLFKF